jgi:hypothetical protein
MKTQLILLSVLTLASSCSWRKSDYTSSELVTNFPHHWFKVNLNHSLMNQSGSPLSHLLFDTTPEFMADKEVNVIIATPEGSEHAYEIDLSSGQRYYSHSFCSQNDIWNQYSGSLNRPPFSIGYIPRVLDQLGGPQKVIVWSNQKNFAATASSNYHKVKLVGAFVEQICPEGNCIGKSNWLSRLVFLGVDAEDTSLNKITSVDDFKKAVNWETSKAHLENLEGRNFIGELSYPFTRVGALIEHAEAFDYFKKRAIFLTDTELKKIQKGCHALYDGLWEEVGKIRPEDKAAGTVEELNAKIKLQESLKAKRVPVGFAARLRTFTKKYFKEISTCDKFVYHGNINKDRETFWFLSYMGIYFRLHREGYYFDCQRKTWQRNVLNEEGKPVHDLVRDIDKCQEAELDQAMDYLPNFLMSLKGEKDYFKFVDYDNQTHGTHQKLYSWVKVKSRKFDCRKDPNQALKKDLRVFPEDVNWIKRNIKDIADEMKIIY